VQECSSDLFVAPLAGIRNPLKQILEFRGAVRMLGNG
jgi:hypothetical protein